MAAAYPHEVKEVSDLVEAKGLFRSHTAEEDVAGHSSDLVAPAVQDEDCKAGSCLEEAAAAAVALAVASVLVEASAAVVVRCVTRAAVFHRLGLVVLLAVDASEEAANQEVDCACPQSPGKEHAVEEVE